MKLLLENWKKYINEGIMDDKLPGEVEKINKSSREKGMKALGLAEDDSKSDIEKTVKDVLKDEGGAAGLDPIKKAVEDLDLPDGFNLKDFLKGLRGVGQHEDGDYILEDGEEIDVREGIEIFLEAQDDVLEEKRRSKRGKGRKKKKKKKKKKKDACYHKVRARYDVWPSAYASGALVKCRKVGAKNWGNKSKKNESIDLEAIIREEVENYLDEKATKCWSGYKKNPEGPKSGPGSCVPAEENMSKQELEEKKKKKKRKLTSKPSSETSLRDWFGRKGAKGKKGGWVDCNTCKTVRTKSGKKRKSCKACGRSGSEKRSKYPSCRPTPSACGKRGKWGKKSKAGKKG